MAKATHIRLKNKVKVHVERFEGGILVVRNMRGKFIGTYEKNQTGLFQKRYRSLAVKKKRNQDG